MADTTFIWCWSLGCAYYDEFVAEAVKSIPGEFSEHLIGTAEFVAGDATDPDVLKDLLSGRDDVGDETSEDVLEAVKLKDRVYHGRYTQGSINGKEFPSYVDEKGVDPENNTETWAHVEVEIDTDRWRGVPITLESGKAVGSFEKLIRVTYKTLADELPDRFEIEFNDDGISLMVGAPDPANSGEPQKICLSGEVSEFDFSAYGRVVAAIMEGRNELEVSRRAAEQGWELMDIIAERLTEVTMWEYPAGSTREEIMERGRSFE